VVRPARTDSPDRPVTIPLHDLTDDSEAEKGGLRERKAELESRLDNIEAELGIDATASQQVVADD
jgi:hypothetical protein